MYFFLIPFLLIYGGMHIYAFFKLQQTFKLKNHLLRILSFWMIFMTLTPLFVRLAESFKIEKLTPFLAWSGYVWMGFLFIFCSMLLCSDIFILIFRLINKFYYNKLSSFISSINLCKFIFVIAILTSIYAFIEATQIKTDYVTITSPKLSPDTISKIRVVQISDLHIGLLLQKGRLHNIIEKIKEAKPDLLVSTGDLVDGKLNRNDALSNMQTTAALLDSIPTKFGKYAIIGNHEVYAGIEQSAQFTRAAGFTILRNQYVQPVNGLIISGVDDLAVLGKSLYIPEAETTMLSSISQKAFNLFLKHRPDIVPESDGRFDLQLSGHVHGGQIFPFNFLVKIKHSIPCGTTVTPAGSKIHVSRGTGTWGPPMRLFVPPEVTVIDIIPADMK